MIDCQTIYVHTYEGMKRIEMENMCTVECMKKIDPSCPVFGGTVPSSPCGLAPLHSLVAHTVRRRQAPSV